MAGAMLVSGLLYTHYAGRAYVAMVALCLLGLATAILLRRRDTGPLAEGEGDTVVGSKEAR